jgi:putative ABC transport system substrate-binding protein
VKRREFMTMLAGAVFTPLPVTAQEPKRLPLIALVLVAAAPAEIAGPDPTFAPVRAFVHELRDLGWIDGRTAAVEVRSLQGDPQRAADMLAELLGRGVDVIVLGGARWLHDAALRATHTILSLLKSPQGSEGLEIFAGRPYRHGHGDDSLRPYFDLRIPCSQPRLAGT